MRRVFTYLALFLFIASGLFGFAATRPGAIVSERVVDGVSVVVREASEIALPRVPEGGAGYDCNSPIIRVGSTLYSFTSHEHPYRGAGSGLFRMPETAVKVELDSIKDPTPGGRWIEAVHRLKGGRLVMWYHMEPKGLFPTRPHLTAPKIGQMYSDDDGLRWHDQGIVLEASPESFADPETTLNGYFAGGHGDFSVILDREGEYFYFLFSTYPGKLESQGVAVARMKATHVDDPVGHVFKMRDGRFDEPGLGGEATPILPAEADWHQAGSRAPWGPSVHWNSYIQKYVMLLNLTTDPTWTQGGILVSFCARLDDPKGWSVPREILRTDDWYPQVVGLDPGVGESDREAGRTARLFIKGRSRWEIEFRPVLD